MTEAEREPATSADVRERLIEALRSERGDACRAHRMAARQVRRMVRCAEKDGKL